MLGSTAWQPSRLAEARLSAGLTQEALAKALTELLAREAQPLRARSIVRWEKARGSVGAHAPHPDFVAAIAHATGHPIGYFFGESVDQVDPVEEARERIAQALAKIGGGFEELTDVLNRQLHPAPEKAAA